MPRVNYEVSSTSQSTPPLKVRIAPIRTELEKRQNKALKELMDKRARAVKKTGNYPNYHTN